MSITNQFYNINISRLNPYYNGKYSMSDPELKKQVGKLLS